MIRAIVGASLRFRLLVLGIAAGIMIVGITQLRDAPTDVLPEFTPAYVEVQTEALGLSAEEVEQLITVPLEADLLNGVEGIDTLRSSSVSGLSSIVMVFEPGTDIYKARQLVQEPLTQAHALPNVSKAPTMVQPLSSSSRVMMIALSSDKLTPIEKSVIARWTIRPRLMGVAGVANVSVFGMRDQQLQVQVDPGTLRNKNVTLKQVIATTGNAHQPWAHGPARDHGLLDRRQLVGRERDHHHAARRGQRLQHRRRLRDVRQRVRLRERLLHELARLVDVGAGLEHHHDRGQARNGRRAEGVDPLHAVQQVRLQRNGDQLLHLFSGEAERLGLHLDVRRRELGQHVGRRIPQLRDADDHDAGGDTEHEQPEPQARSDDRTNHLCPSR